MTSKSPASAPHTSFIGRTGLVANVLKAQIPRLQQSVLGPIERRLLFTGPPGIGKSDLARQFGVAVAGHSLNVDFRIGTSVSVDLVRDWSRSSPFRPLFGHRYVRGIDELDTVPAASLIELRDYLDNLPPTTLFIATTNKPIKQLAEPLQSRFKLWYFEPVPADAIRDLLIRRYPDLPPATLGDIADRAEGNVRAALTDAEGEMDVFRYTQTQTAAELCPA